MTSTLVIIQASEINAPIGTYVYASINDNTHTTKGKIWQFWGPTTSHDELMRWDWCEIFCYGWIEQLPYFDKKKLRMNIANSAKKNYVEMKRALFSNTENVALFGCLAVLFIYVQKTSTCLIRPKGFFHLHFWVVFVNIGLKNDVLIFVLVLWYKTKKAKKSMYFSCCCH